MLSTDEKHSYQKLGWRQFQGERFVRFGKSEIRAVEDDDDLMIHPEMNCGTIETQRDICEHRCGDDW